MGSIDYTNVYDGALIQHARKRIMAASPHIETASDDLVNFNTNIAAPLKECKVYFEPVQEGEGDPSPENVRPIRGWNEVDVYRSGKNIGHIIGYSATSTSSPTSNRTLSGRYGNTINTTNPDQLVIITQTQYDETVVAYHYKNGYFTVIFDNLKYGEIYNISFKVTNILNNPLNVTLNSMSIDATSGAGSQSYVSQVVGNTVIFKNITFRQHLGVPDRMDIAIYNCGMSCTISDIMVTPAGMNDGVFEPYCGEVIPATFPPEAGTIYGGYVDLVNGEIVQTHKSVILNGSENWGNYRSSDQLHFYLTIDEKKAGIGTSTCDVYPNVKSINFWDKIRYAQYGDHDTISRIYVNAPYQMPGLVDEWKAYLADHPMHLVYELKTPIEYPIAPQTLKTLRGTNNIWSTSNGPITIKYWKH